MLRHIAPFLVQAHSHMHPLQTYQDRKLKAIHRTVQHHALNIRTYLFENFYLVCVI